MDEINFTDLACLLQIKPDMALEKFGSAINASIFDASNLAGTLKQKGLIDFTSYYPGPNTLIITDAGKNLIAEADTRSAEQFDILDETILTQLSTGKKAPIEIQNTLNLRPRDLAMRLYKLYKQGLLIYELKSGTVDLLLTESGFLKTSKQKAQPAAKPAAHQPQHDATREPEHQTATAQQQPATEPQPAQTNEQQPQQQAQAMPQRQRGRRGMLPIIVIAVLLVILVIVYLIRYQGL
ncbi:MAG: hypothetical protein KGH69_02380 [Candidatus Micrarchaeota archaeon]|nr:hypothetical protein [Candidatus Micrarchaeota archaeon]